MHYAFEFDVETSNTIDDPCIGEMQLGAGWLRHVSIEFLAGCNRHVKCFIMDRANQILPTNIEGIYAGNGRVIDIDCYIELPSENNLLYFYGYNVDAVWPHTIGVELDVEGPDEPNIWRILEDFSNLIERLIDLMRRAF